MAAPAGIDLRHIVVPDDVPAWLTLRDRATKNLSPPVRRWTPDDFMVEMTGKPWWRDDRTWLAIAGELRSPQSAAQVARKPLVGAVTLAERTGRAGSVAVVHWLLVDPAWRRRGIGRLLMSHLERAAWADGRREVHVETHAGWTEAVAFYRAMGYDT